MLKRFKIPLAFLAGTCFALVAWALPGCGKQEAVFLIKNESGGALSNVAVLHEKGQVEIGQLGAGQEIKVSIPVLGESSAHIQASLPNGALLSSKESYIESGYCVIEQIGPAGISSASKINGCWL
jgi:hypothetical protein